jgi:hypothetical protein
LRKRIKLCLSFSSERGVFVLQLFDRARRCSLESLVRFLQRPSYIFQLVLELPIPGP